MDTTKVKRDILIAGAVKMFVERVGRQPDAAEMDEIKSSMNLPADTEKQFFGCMDEFATQEMKTALEEMANAWLKEEQDLDSFTGGAFEGMDTAALVEKLNFEVFRHRYPQITFENGGDRITVSIRK